MKSRSAAQKNEPKTKKSARFYSDSYADNMLYALLVRSPIPNGTIRSINYDSLPEGYALFSSRDIPKENNIRTFNTEFPVFASERVSYLGEPIGIIVGPDIDKLHCIRKNLDIAATQAFKTTKKKEKSGEKDILASRSFSYGNFEQAWDKAHIKADKSYRLTLPFPSTSETDGAFCSFNGQKLSIHTPTRWESHLRRNISAVLGCAQADIELYKTPHPLNNTNSPWHNTALTVQCALASFLTERPVLLTLSRNEQLQYIERPLPVSIRHKTVLNSDGCITAASVYISVDAGAFNPFIRTLLDRLAVSCLNMYRTEHVAVEAYAYRSHTAAGAPSMQWADYHGFYAAEAQIQELSRLSGLNPAQIKLQNIEKPVKNAHKNLPFFFDTEAAVQVIQEVIRQSDFYRKYASYKLTGFNPAELFSPVPLRGIGIACAYEGSDFLGTDLNSMRRSLEVSMEKDGSAVIHADTSSETVQNIWKKTAAQILSIPVEAVSIEGDAALFSEAEVPETLISNISVMTQLLKKCCHAIQKLRFRQPLPIKVKRSLTAPKKDIWNPDSFCGTPYYTVSWAAAAAEIELNPQTYTYTVRNIWLSIDGGNILHDSKAEAAVRQSIRRLFSCFEEFQNSPFPAVSVNFIPSGSEPKQIGDLVFNVLPAAITNAVSQALQSKNLSFPIKPKSLYDIAMGIKKIGEIDAHTDNHKR